MELVIAVIAGLVLFAIIAAFLRAPGNLLQQKFARLGQLPGKSKEEIISAVGPPNSISAAANGNTLLQWLAAGYQIALLFDGDVCLGITHEFSG